NALANIYLSYKGQIEDANTKAIDIIQKAKSIIEILDRDELTYSFEENFERKLAQAYYSRRIQSESPSSANEDFYQAIDHYDMLLQLGVADQEDTMVTIGSIYEEIGELAQAVSYYQEI